MNTVKFDKKCKCGPEFVCVRIIENCDNLKVGDIYIPSTARANDRLAHCIIEDVGWKAAEEYGIAVGDYVLIDRLSTFSHTAPIALLKYNNVIAKTNSDMSDFFPLKNMVFVEEDKNDPISKVGDIYTLNGNGKILMGTITKMNCSPEAKVEYKAGDKVMLTKGADVVQLGNVTLRIYKHDMIICTVEG